MGLDFRHTGLPRGHKIEITKAQGNANGSNSSGFAGKDIYITAITNYTQDDSYVTVTYSEGSGWNSEVKAPKGSANSWPAPLGPFKSFYVSSNHSPTDGVAVFYVLVDND